MTRFQVLRELLELVEPQRPLWFVPGVGAIRAETVGTWLARQSPLQSRIQDHNVLIRADDPIGLAPLLVALDGVCRQITLLSGQWPAEHLAEVAARSQSDIVFASGPAGAHFEPIDTQSVDLTPLGLATRDGAWTAFFLSNSHPGEAATRPDAAQRHLTRWVLPTSGTTGTPKLVVHSLASLTRSAKFDQDRGGAYRWGALYNLTGFAGLQVFLQSWCAGSCLILGNPDDTLQQRVAALLAAGCTALSATPTMWRKLLMGYRIEHLPLRQITLGGEIVDQKILDALTATFPAARITHIYASTEAGVGFAVHDSLAGFPADYLLQPPVDVRIAVDPQGQLLLQAPCAEQEYLGDNIALRDERGFVETGDLVARRGDRYYFLGRANGTINVGGNKVHPEEVEGFLLGCEGVQMARVSARKSPFTGQLVQAEVVPDPAVAMDRELWQRQLLAACRAALAPYKVPAVLRVVDGIEATATGKLKRAN